MTQAVRFSGTAVAPGRAPDEIPVRAPDDVLAPREKRVAQLRLLWNCRVFLLRMAFAGALLACAIAFVIPKRYESEAQLMPPDNQSGAGLAVAAALANQAGGMGGMAGDLLGLKSSGALFVGVLNSRTIHDRLVARFDLQKVYGTRLDETARRILAERTAVTEDRKSGIISIRVSDRDAPRAAALANAYAEELDRLVGQLATSSARREREFLEQRLQAVRGDLERDEKDFSEFASKNAAIDIPAQGKAMVEAGAALQGELIAAESELQGLKQIYTEKNVRVRATQARATELRRQLDKLGGRASRASGANDSDPERATSATADSPYPSLRQLPLLGVPYADLYRRSKVQEAVFEALTKEYELAKVQEAKEIPTVRVLDAAPVPQTKAFPPRLLMTMLGTLAGFGFGASWILGRARWDAVPPGDPAKRLAQEAYSAARAWHPFSSRNGASHGAETLKRPGSVTDEEKWPER